MPYRALEPSETYGVVLEHVNLRMLPLALNQAIVRKKASYHVVQVNERALHKSIIYLTV